MVTQRAVQANNNSNLADDKEVVQTTATTAAYRGGQLQICDLVLTSSMTTSKLTVVAQDKEASPGEVGVELDEDDVGGGVNRLQSRVPAELTNLRRGLVGTIPAMNNNKETKKAEALRHLEDNLMSQSLRECTLFFCIAQERSRSRLRTPHSRYSSNR